MMKLVSLVVSSALSLHTVSASDWLKEIIIESHERLAAEGFYAQEEKPDSVLNQPQTCTDGKVTVDGEDFECSEVDFLSFVSLNDLEVETLDHPFGFRSADIWGWLSPTGRELTLLSLDNGVAIVDTDDALNPCVLAKFPTTRDVDIWADVKVFNNTMYHVKDKRGGDAVETANIGIEVYDLLPIDELDCKVDGFVVPYFQPDFVFAGHGRSHNVFANTESGRLYTVGAEVCASGFVVMDVSNNRLEPEQIGCLDADGYTHDGQCVTYDGPDVEHTGKEICFGFNEDTVTIWDATDMSNPVILSRSPYFNQGYTHQGWINDDFTRLILDDELDELCNSENPHSRCAVATNGRSNYTNTSTDIFDITDLDSPIFLGAYVHPQISIDHNLYVWGTVHRKGWGGNPPLEYYPDPNYVYLSNYLAGLRILDIHSEDIEEWFEAGFFDISPNRIGLEFAGAWSSYMHPSGVLAVSSIERGLFLLSPRMAFTDEFPAPPQTTEAPVVAPIDEPVDPPATESPVPVSTGGDGIFGDSSTTVLVLAAVIVLLAMVAIGLMLKDGKVTSKANEAKRSAMNPMSMAN